MHTIIEAVKRKYESSDLKTPDFYVWFNEVSPMISTPSSVPSHLTEATRPQEIYGVEREEVYESYLNQFERDLEAFLKCRDVEMVKGGIMALLIPALPAYWDPQTEFTVASVIELLRSSLVDMAKKGRLSETNLDAFNFPCYIPTPEQVWAILQKSNSFSIERNEILKSGTLLTVDGHFFFMDSKDNRHFSMNGRDGIHSYVKNSSYQKGVLETAKAIIEEEIATKLDISTNTFFGIADFGCSTGNNSFPAMHTIIEAVKRKYESSDLKTPDFYVWFNDVVSNDFNTLLNSLPPDRSYEVYAVPGGFRRYLLPPSSVHFAYYAWSLHWLSEGLKSLIWRE
ncbi:hypothetical protein SASPL_151363 [Salvia splendens]|uniref:Jasmonate O-methyltransferase n=1 Tax=Salvia splendens TaxID=180675 RepID=A0A8X8W7W0_SALSN|nr:hypothetical protein SASPL_151363 [Salvia splendens]